MADSRFRVRVVQAGLSLNSTFYSDDVLRRHVAMFEGARVFAMSDREHMAGSGKDVRNLIGGIYQPEFVPGDLPDTGAIYGTLRLIDAENGAGRTIGKAVELGLQDLFGLSIAVFGRSRQDGARGVRIAETFEKVASVDLIVEPGAGGRVIAFTEAAGTPSQGPIMNRDELVALIKATRPEALDGKDAAAMTEEELRDLLTSLLKPADPARATTQAGWSEAVNAAARLRERVTICGLPNAAKDKLRGEIAAGTLMTEAQLTARIGEEARYLSAAGIGGGHVQGLGAVVGDGPFEKGEQMLDAFFDRSHKDHAHARSFRECYVMLTGDRHVTGRLPQGQRMTEALTSASFANVLGASITRRMVAEYRRQEVYDIWRKLANVVPLRDFRTQERVRFGGYGDLPTVAESAAYLPLASPGDEKATYAPAKRGGTESVTLEMVTNDDVGSIQAIPLKLARAAKRTLAKFALDFIRTNPAIYDGKALFHVDHGNLITLGLSATSYAATRLAMMQQRELSSLDPIGIGPSFLWVPAALEETAYNIFQRSTNNDKTFVQTLTPTIMPVWYWADENDWAVSADPTDIPTIEIGFVGNNEEPELFVQDNPSVGSFFTNDVITYKVRHIYGGNVVDFRGMVKSVVA